MSERRGWGWGRVSGFAAGLTAGVAVCWLLLGAALALGGWEGYALSLPGFLAVLMAPFGLYRLAGERTWATWLGLALSMALMITAYAVPGDWYLRAYGKPAEAVVADRAYVKSKSSGYYRYSLERLDGTPIEGDLEPGGDHPIGARLEVMVDPRGHAAPRLREDLESHAFEIVAGVTFGLWLLLAIAAGVAGELLRRRPPPPKPAKPTKRPKRPNRNHAPRRRTMTDY